MKKFEGETKMKEVKKVNKIENEKENVTMEKKQFGIKEISKLLGINEVSFRSWTLKGEVGEVYDSSKVNYKQVKRMLIKYFESEEKFKEKFGFEIDQIEIVKREKKKNLYVVPEQLLLNEEYTIMNYSLKYYVKLLDILQEDQIVYLFKDLEKNTYRAYGQKELKKDNMKIMEGIQ